MKISVSVRCSTRIFKLVIDGPRSESLYKLWSTKSRLPALAPHPWSKTSSSYGFFPVQNVEEPDFSPSFSSAGAEKTASSDENGGITSVGQRHRDFGRTTEGARIRRGNGK